MVAERKPTWKETEGFKEIRGGGEEKEKDLGENGAGLIFHVENGSWSRENQPVEQPGLLVKS